MKKLYINNVVSKEVEHIVSAAGIIDLFPKDVILQYNWLITDYSGDISRGANWFFTQHFFG